MQMSLQHIRAAEHQKAGSRNKNEKRETHKISNFKQNVEYQFEKPLPNKM